MTACTSFLYTWLTRSLVFALVAFSHSSWAFSTIASNNKPFALNVKFTVKPDRRDEFLQVIKDDVKQTLLVEPNAMQFVLGEDVDTPNTFYLHEEYQTQEDHATTHSESEHFARAMTFFGSDPFDEPLVAQEFFLAHEGHDSKRVNVPNTFCLNVELCIQPDMREEFLVVIANNKKGSDQEPLCLQYSYGEHTDRPNHFYFHEQYKGANEGLEGFEAHTKAPHFQVWEEFASKNPFTKPPVVEKYKLIVE